jgi:DNA-binding XRE family transcriptional regulator
VILDPPYSDEEALELYATPKLRPAQYTREAVRVCKLGGWVVVYTDREPRGRRAATTTMRIVVVLRPTTGRACAWSSRSASPGCRSTAPSPASPLVARTLRELRLDRGLSLRDLSELAGLNRATVSQIERGRLVATPAELSRLEAALDLPLATLNTKPMAVYEEERRA